MEKPEPFILYPEDPASPGALRAYAHASKLQGRSAEYVETVQALAFAYENWRKISKENT